LAIWRAHPESYTYKVACGTPATWPNDHKWHHAVDGFRPGRANPVPLATVSLSPAFERVRAPFWPPHWGRGTVVRDLERLGAGFIDGVTRTIWLLTYGATSFPVLIHVEAADELHRLAGLAGRGPVSPERFFVLPTNMPEWQALDSAMSVGKRSTATHAVHENEAMKPLHPPLLSALSKFKRSSIQAGTLLFHSGRSKNLYADSTENKLTGTRKWFS